MITIIIPAYNEEKRIKNTLELYANFFLDKYPDCELIVISDGQDSTADIVKKMSREYSRIFLFEYENRLGKGGAILEGFKKAKGDTIAFADADEAVSPLDMEKIIKALVTIDCAIGSRRVPGSKILKKQPLSRALTSKAFNIMVNLFFNLDISDTQCGAKAFRRNVIAELLPAMKSKGFEFDVELLWRIKSCGFSIEEIPIQWKHEKESSFNLKYAPQMFINLLKFRIG